MFKVGDKIVCVMASSMGSVYTDKNYCLTLNKTYTVVDIKSEKTVSIINDQNNQQPFNIVRFVAVAEFRKQKLNKICSKLEIK